MCMLIILEILIKFGIIFWIVQFGTKMIVSKVFEISKHDEATGTIFLFLSAIACMIIVCGVLAIPIG